MNDYTYHQYLENVLVIDVETSGLSVFENDILSVYISPLLNHSPSLDLHIKYRKKALKWEPVAKQFFNKYSSQWELEAVYEDIAWEHVKEYFKKLSLSNEIVLAGHNVAIDYYFLKKLAHLNNESLPSNISHRLVDTHTILFLLHTLDMLPKTALDLSGALAHFEIDIDENKRHTARGDVDATKKLFLLAVSKLKNQNS